MSFPMSSGMIDLQVRDWAFITNEASLALYVKIMPLRGTAHDVIVSLETNPDDGALRSASILRIARDREVPGDHYRVGNVSSDGSFYYLWDGVTLSVSELDQAITNYIHSDRNSARRVP